MSKEHKLDIFDVMAAVDRRDATFLERQPPEAKKGFVPVVCLRWASAVTGPDHDHYLMAINEFANSGFHDLADHPELQYRLISMAGTQSRQRHQWIPLPKSEASKSSKVEAFVWDFFPMANKAEVNMLISTLTRETFIEFVDRSGCSPEQRKEVISAWDKKHKSETVKKGATP